MFINVRKSIILLVIGMLILMESGFLINRVSAQSDFNPDSTNIFIDSRFKLWDEYEKMLDDTFNITIVYINQSVNHSAYYKIDIDNNITEGNFTYFVTNQFYINETLIHYLRIYINNESVFYETNIIIDSDVTKDSIDYGKSIWTINLSPLEWTQKERNIFFAGIISFLVSLPMVYFIIKTNKKGHGIKTYK